MVRVWDLEAQAYLLNERATMSNPYGVKRRKIYGKFMKLPPTLQKTLLTVFGGVTALSAALPMLMVKKSPSSKS